VRMRDPGAWFESWNCVSTGSCFVRLEVVSIAQYPGHLQRSVEVPSTGVHQALRESYPVSHCTAGKFIPRSATVFGSNFLCQG
jgi:hypothetical protein